MCTFIKYKLNGVNGDVHPTNTVARQINTATGKDIAAMGIIWLSLVRELGFMMIILASRAIWTREVHFK